MGVFRLLRTGELEKLLMRVIQTAHVDATYDQGVSDR